MHGGLKFYRGAARAARAHVEIDHSRADDYYLREGSGVAVRLIATPDVGVQRAGSMDGESYERRVAGVDLDTGRKKGHVRADANALRFVEVVIKGRRPGRSLEDRTRKAAESIMAASLGAATVMLAE